MNAGRAGELKADAALRGDGGGRGGRELIMRWDGHKRSQQVGVVNDPSD